eukprot:Nitzschia sp. Nitz4//scaffold82_size85912//16973//17794//NITZ4_005129-RA/size85912-processed-gene-0.25-mRNA-1//-1//CDS//3329558799//6745//frame0
MSSRVEAALTFSDPLLDVDEDPDESDSSGEVTIVVALTGSPLSNVIVPLDQEEEGEQGDEKDARGFRAAMQRRSNRRSSFNTVSSCSCSFRSMPSLRSIDEQTDLFFLADDDESVRQEQLTHVSTALSVSSLDSTVTGTSTNPNTNNNKNNRGVQILFSGPATAAPAVGGVTKDGLSPQIPGRNGADRRLGRWDVVEAQSGSSRALQPPSRPPITPQLPPRQSISSSESSTGSNSFKGGTRRGLPIRAPLDCRPTQMVRVPSHSSVASSVESA